MSGFTAEQLTTPVSAGAALQSPAPSSSPSASAQTASTNSDKRVIRVGVSFDAGVDHFNHAYTVRGHAGGRSAAADLHQSVKDLIRKDKLDKVSESDFEIKVFVSSFLNVQSLADYTGNDIRSFAQGFSSSSFVASMTDVGEDSNAVISALKNHLPFLVSTCDYVIFGGSHTNQYHKNLHSLRDHDLQDKVILLRTSSPCANKIFRLGLSEARFPRLLKGRLSTELHPSAPAEAAPDAESCHENSEADDENETGDIGTHEIPEQFVDLVDVLRSQFGGFATFSRASYLITRRGSKMWGEGHRYLSFGKYVREAYRAGIVENGLMPGQRRTSKANWVKLQQRYQLNTSSCRSTSTSTQRDLIPSEFIPLLTAFVHEGMTTSTRQNLADRVLANGDRSMWDEEDWQTYLGKAERLGIVQRSRSGQNDSSLSMITLRRSL